MVVFAEYTWTPGDLVQAEDRAHRIGQASSVNIYFLHVKASIDDLIWQKLGRKLEHVGQVTMILHFSRYRRSQSHCINHRLQQQAWLALQMPACGRHGHHDQGPFRQGLARKLEHWNAPLALETHTPPLGGLSAGAGVLSTRLLRRVQAGKAHRHHFRQHPKKFAVQRASASFMQVLNGKEDAFDLASQHTQADGNQRSLRGFLCPVSQASPANGRPHPPMATPATGVVPFLGGEPSACIPHAESTAQAALERSRAFASG